MAYKSVTTKLKTQVETVQTTIPDLITTLAWIFTGLLVWLLISQLGLWAQGLEMLQGFRVEMNPK